jgi:putative endonuclease
VHPDLHREGQGSTILTSQKNTINIKIVIFFMPMPHIYILYSATKNKFYIGCTSDNLEERIRKHNSNHKGFTGNVNDWVLSYAETFELKNDAFAREREIKKWKSRKKIEELIKPK